MEVIQMNDKIKNFGVFKQEFDPKKLYELIHSFNEEQLLDLNRYIVGVDEVDGNIEEWRQPKSNEYIGYEEQLLFYPNEYLYGLCCNDSNEYPNIGFGGTFDFEWDNIWEHRFDFSNEVWRIHNEK